MNEAQILMYLLSRKLNESVIGTAKEDICSKLGLSGKNSDYQFWKLMREFNTSIFPLGLMIKYNAVNNHWFIGFQDKMESKFAGSIHTLSPRLAATLFTILLLYMGQVREITFEKIMDLRSKQDISLDLKDLVQLGYITTDKNVVMLTPKIFYFIDINELNEKLKEFINPSN